MSDELPQLNEPLTGYIVLDNSPEREIPAVLRDTGERIELMIPFKDIRTIPGNWFVSSWLGDEGGLVVGSQVPDSIPHELLFVCNARSFTLVGCRGSGMTMSMGLGPGTGTVVPTYMVCGGRHSHYAEINGLRTQCLDLIRWFDLPSTSLIMKQDEVGRCDNVNVCSTKIPPLSVDERVGLVIRPVFEVSESSRTDSIISHESVLIETKMEHVASWEEHLSIHRAIKDLISISDWNSREFTDMTAMRSDDPKLIVEGKVMQDKWSSVVSYYPLVQRNNAANFQDTFLFSYQDMGVAGINKWITLRENCRKGTALISYLARDHKHLALETLSMLTGTALECVGWYIVQSEHQENRIKKRSDKEQPKTYKDMLDAVAEKLGVDFPFKSSDAWANSMKNTYISSKHVDAGNVDFQTMYQATMQSLVILRMWLGAQIGVNIAIMRQRLYQDGIGKNIRNMLA
ncbi:HEPN domain-containing protein [Bifidobacterium callitrichidarum]|uniref:ApeA N-terminal domain 1-containing protein n=1 Tax=Bifidobacterium callitrichidarum TaxID=2052941 RepID=UPI0011B246CB|nr:HEPN domain-containing protein [Bifidobacterium callitrichidarum]